MTGIFSRAAAIGVAAFALTATQALAQIAVSAQDGHTVLVDGVATTPDNPLADYVAVLDIGSNPPRIVGEVAAPASVVGPPQSVAVAADESIALVTSSAKIDPADSKKRIPDDTLSVIDLKASPPKLLQTLHAGLGAAGVSINRAGTLALVANSNEGTVSVFTIANKILTPGTTVDLGNAKSGPSHVVFSPDGKIALVTREGDFRISVLSVDGNNVAYTKRDIFAGLRPYSIEMSASGDIAVVSNTGMGNGDADTVSIIDMKSTPPRVVDTVTVGPTPEAVRLSPNGRFLAVNVINGSNKSRTSPIYHDFGIVRIFSVKGTKLTPVTEARVGHWCQGLAWSRSGETLIVQCMVENSLMVYSFDGEHLWPGNPIKMKAGPAGLRTATW